MPELLLTAGDAAKRLDVSPSMVTVLAKLGRIEPRARTERGILLFTPESVARLDAQRRAAAAAKERKKGTAAAA